MTSWNDFTNEQPELAGTVQERFARYRHHVLATLRADGSPRVSGIEADFREGELWLGSMVSARKALDLRRDPRFALHANPGPGTDMDGGDVRIGGRAVEVTDEETYRWYVDAVHPPEPFHLFRVDVAEVVRVWVEGEEMVTAVWRAGRGSRVLRRGTDDAPPREV
jgi:hypothetical protein